ncbi:MAG: hypothetical protein LBO72_08755 [Helicobacteraceae bacterium]|jgi:hypothetical protein|nr:hypothetical protein [Helicobacteraceae bacterium]
MTAEGINAALTLVSVFTGSELSETKLSAWKWVMQDYSDEIGSKAFRRWLQNADSPRAPMPKDITAYADRIAADEYDAQKAKRDALLSQIYAALREKGYYAHKMPIPTETHAPFIYRAKEIDDLVYDDYDRLIDKGFSVASVQTNGADKLIVRLGDL